MWALPPAVCRISCSWKGAGSLYPTQCGPSLPACLQDLMFLGDFEMAKMRAQQEAKWLLLNLQDSNEFDSHR